MYKSFAQRARRDECDVALSASSLSPSPSLSSGLVLSLRIVLQLRMLLLHYSNRSGSGGLNGGALPIWRAVTAAARHAIIVAIPKDMSRHLHRHEGSMFT